MRESIHYGSEMIKKADALLIGAGATRLNSIWYGATRTKKIEAVKKAVEYAEAA